MGSRGTACLLHEPASVTDDEEPEVDIAALLAMTFEARPSADLASRVESRVVLRTTVAEMARLLLVSPWHWVRADDTSLAEGDDR